MQNNYGVVTPRRSFVVMQKGNKYRFVWWLFKGHQFHKAVTIALISEPANTLVVTDKGKEKPVEYTPPDATAMAKALPPWTLTRYVYFFKTDKPGEIWDLKDKKLLGGKEYDAIVSAVAPEITSLTTSLVGVPQLWGQYFGASDTKKK